jgi:L-alanine-DL-glutamate epimerase-like enolase superfamily enzyme
MSLPNAMVQEGVRAYYSGGWYQDVVTALPHVENGFVSAPDGPGLGLQLQPEFLQRSDIQIRSRD